MNCTCTFNYLFLTVEVYNSQVMLKGLETSGYVIVAAAKASILSRDHQPVWKDRHLKSKTTWVGSLECMQVLIMPDILVFCKTYTELIRSLIVVTDI